MNKKTIALVCNQCPIPLAYLNVAIPATGPLVLDHSQRWMQSVLVARPVKISITNLPAYRHGAFLLRLAKQGNPLIEFDAPKFTNASLALTPNGTDVLKIRNNAQGELVIENEVPNTCCCRPIY